MPDGYADEARDALLAKAHEAWKDAPDLDRQVLGDGSGRDSVSAYLRAYYQRVATEDLAPPSRLATVAEAHARLGLSRPQGRAVVEVREPDGAHLNPLSGSGLVVDILTDDMPYLVDSVTTELNRHEAEILLLLHPVLQVHRDVAGGPARDPRRLRGRRRPGRQHGRDNRVLDPRRARLAPGPGHGRSAGRGPAARA